LIPGDLPIVVTLGNHEFWGRTFEDTLEKLKAQIISDKNIGKRSLWFNGKRSGVSYAK